MMSRDSDCQVARRLHAFSVGSKSTEGHHAMQLGVDTKTWSTEECERRQLTRTRPSHTSRRRPLAIAQPGPAPQRADPQSRGKAASRSSKDQRNPGFLSPFIRLFFTFFIFFALFALLFIISGSSEDFNWQTEPSRVEELSPRFRLSDRRRWRALSRVREWLYAALASEGVRVLLRLEGASSPAPPSHRPRQTRQSLWCRMKLTVLLQGERLIIPCGDGSSTIGWLCEESSKRRDAVGDLPCGVTVHLVRRLPCGSILCPGDKICDVLRDGDEVSLGKCWSMLCKVQCCKLCNVPKQKRWIWHGQFFNFFSFFFFFQIQSPRSMLMRETSPFPFQR